MTLSCPILNHIKNYSKLEKVCATKSFSLWQHMSGSNLCIWNHFCNRYLMVFLINDDSNTDLLVLAWMLCKLKNIKYLCIYNYCSRAWIKVTSHANLGSDRVWSAGGAGRGWRERARAGTPTLPGCDSATLEPAAPRPAPLAPHHPAPPRPPRTPRPRVSPATP